MTLDPSHACLLVNFVFKSLNGLSVLINTLWTLLLFISNMFISTIEQNICIVMI